MSIRVATVQDVIDIADGAMCANCGRPMRGERSRGALTYRSDPHELFWHGLKILDVLPAQARIMSLLIRLGSCNQEALAMVLPTEGATIDTLHVHICYLRKRLRVATGDQVRIETVRGEGYRLVVEQ